MKRFKKSLIHFTTVLIFGLIPAIVCQFFIQEPTDRYIHIRNFRYGKDPSAITCNRGDRLHLTFSTDDTGHSFFLEEFDIDAKVSPAIDEVTVFKPSDPSLKPLITKELVFTAKHPGILNYLVSKSNYRCHVWCGPMHAFEQGKLIILPNTLLIFSLGCLFGVLFLWFTSLFRKITPFVPSSDAKPKMKDLLEKSPLLKSVLLSRWPQIIMIIMGLVMIYIVIITSVFGTKVSGRNLGVLLMWAVWLFVLVAILTPLTGRTWCTICPLPFLGDWIQRRSFFTPEKGSTNSYQNRFYGLFRKWPERLNNSWLRLFVFLLLSTFSTTLVAIPRISGIAVLMLLLIPTLMSIIWELRAFCRYVCPVTVFVAPFSGMSFIALRNKSQAVCNKCKPHFCQNGSATGWACPYGLNVGELQVNTDCGLCLECLRSCSFNNVSVYQRPFGQEAVVRSFSEAWLAISIFTISIIYSVLYLGSWPSVRDYVNILDKQNWDLFGIYTLLMWSSALLFIPGILYLLAWSATRFTKAGISTKEAFLAYAGALLPLGLMLWISFVIPMLFVNITFIQQSASDPFGWGWDFFGTASIPWHQFMPQYIPWFQAILILTGFHLSLKNIRLRWESVQLRQNQVFRLSFPVIFFLTAVSVMMLIFFTN